MKTYGAQYTSWSVFLLSLMVTLIVCVGQLQAQQPGAIQYVYDDLGRLIMVIDANGNAAEYVYDAVGNILEIRRSTLTGLAILDFAPPRGVVGTQVTIQGRGFSATPAENQVGFNGALAPILAATNTQLVVTVPPGATTGPITVTVGGETATSARNFTVPPSITTINPTLTLAGSTISVQVQGNNLTGSTFTFTPASVPLPVAVTSTTIASTGTSATLQVTVLAAAAGNFVLVATNADGRSNTAPSAANTLRILAGNADTDGDGLTNSDELAQGLNPVSADTDGDGFGDGEEVEFGADPLDSGQAPVNISLQLREASGAPVSTLNNTDPGAIPPREVSGPVASVLNPTDPATEPAHETSGSVVSVLNLLDPATEPAREAAGLTVSILNSTDPSGPVEEAAMGGVVSVENLAQ
jgi:YD repeat-containing protein